MVPREAVNKIPEVIDLISRREAKIIEAAKAPGFNIDKLKAAIAGAKEIH